MLRGVPVLPIFLNSKTFGYWILMNYSFGCFLDESEIYSGCCSWNGKMQLYYKRWKIYRRRSINVESSNVQMSVREIEFYNLFLSADKSESLAAVLNSICLPILPSLLIASPIQNLTLSYAYLTVRLH